MGYALAATEVCGRASGLAIGRTRGRRHGRLHRRSLTGEPASRRRPTRARWLPPAATRPGRPRTTPMPDADRTPSDPAKRHSAALTDGPDRAGARAMLKAIGFTDEDLAKPIVGVATTWIETMPCNLNQRHLAEHVKDGIRAAGGTPMEFNTIADQRRRDDGHRGHEGLARQPRGRSPTRSSWSIRGHLFDGARLPRRLRQDRARARRWRSAAWTSPASILYSGTIYPGVYKGQRNATVVTRLRGDRRVPGRQDHARRAVRDRERRPAPARAPAAASTRPTR